MINYKTKTKQNKKKQRQTIPTSITHHKTLAPSTTHELAEPPTKSQNTLNTLPLNISLELISKPDIL